MTHRSADEAKKQNIEKMGEELGRQFSELWQEVAHLHQKWAEYVELFGSKPTRIELLNRAAPAFFGMAQDVLWDDTLLHLARLTDRPGSGKDKENLTIQNLPMLITSADFRPAVLALVDKAISTTVFCRDWRNRRLAHRDLDLAINEAAIPLEGASRTQVNEALSEIVKVLNAVEGHYADSETAFGIGSAPGGALSLLYVLDDGIKANVKREERLGRGELLEEDYLPRDL